MNPYYTKVKGQRSGDLGSGAIGASTWPHNHGQALLSLGALRGHSVNYQQKKKKGSGHTYPFLGPIKMVRRFLNIFGRYVWGDLT